MTPRLLTRSFGILLICTLTACAQETRLQPTALEGRVVAIADGDTVTVLDAANTQHRIRLQGIDAPERAQAFGTRSRENLSTLVFNRQVRVEFNSRDRYGRLLGKVLVEGRDANLEQLRAGMAWFYRQYADQLSTTDRPVYEGAEREARARERGLWSDRQPTPPWDFRRANRPANVDTPGTNETNTDGLNPNSTSRPPITLPTTTTPATNTTPVGAAATGAIIGNRRSQIYHEPNCPNYNDVSPGNRVTFQSRDEAERAGYRRARNCP